MTGAFEPKVVVLCCDWCADAAADLAGVARLPMQPNFAVVRMECSSRVEPEFVMEALRRGADGVMIAGCHPGDCHYVGGNFRALRRFALLRTMLRQFGVDPRRLRLEWVLATEAVKFQQMVNDFVETVRRLGPSPFRASGEG
ncbi:MAG: hydrogenase iron-sulfur subunit [Calditrichaeota bacterium]|nr:hydrogenase iron-sulfur subunit [Calditrichota bacterium]